MGQFLSINFDKALLNQTNITLDKVKEFERDSGVRGAFLAGAKVFVATGRRLLSTRSLGFHHQRNTRLSDSFTARLKRNKLGALAGFDGRGRHAHFVDRGTMARYTENNQYRGIMPANHFWRDTYRQSEITAGNTVITGLSASINKLSK